MRIGPPVREIREKLQPEMIRVRRDVAHVELHPKPATSSGTSPADTGHGLTVVKYPFARELIRV